MSNASTQFPDRTKVFKSGYCKLCRWAHEGELNEKIKQGQNAGECRRWAETKYDFRFNRQTFYNHKEHLNNPPPVAEPDGKALVPSPHGGVTQIRKTSNREFLETIRDIGYTKATLDPDSVTLEHAMKAASIIEQSKQKQTDIAIVFAQVVTGHTPDVIVEGEAREVEPVTNG